MEMSNRGAVAMPNQPRNPTRLGRGRGKRARGARGSNSRGRGSRGHLPDFNPYRERNPQSPEDTQRLGRGRGSSRGGGRSRGRARRVMQPPRYDNSSPIPSQQAPVQPAYEISAEPQFGFPAPVRTHTPDLAPDLTANAQLRIGMPESNNMSFSTSPANGVQTGPGMRPLYAARVASPSGMVSAQQAFVYPSYPMRSLSTPPPASAPSHLIHTSPAAMSVLTPRAQSPFEPLPPQHRQPIYSTEVHKSYQYAAHAPAAYQTYNSILPPTENSPTPVYADLGTQHYSPPSENPYAAAPFSADDYGRVVSASHLDYECTPATHTSDYNPYSDPSVKRQKSCTFFNSTMGCKYGDKCRFLHVKDDSVPKDFAICWDFNTLRGCGNPNCKWEHRACSEARKHPYEDIECKPEYGLKNELREQEKKEQSELNLSDGSDNQSVPEKLDATETVLAE